MISSLYIVVPFRKKFHGSTNFWAGVASLSADGPYKGFRRRIVNVAKIPCEEIVHAMDRRCSNMQGIGFRPSRHTALGDQPAGKRLDLLVNGQFCKAL